MAVDRDSYLRHVFNTVAAYYATGGFAETSRKRIPSSPAYTSVDVGMAKPRPLQVLVGWVASFSGDLGRGFCEVR
jgi:hypothetical protein